MIFCVARWVGDFRDVDQWLSDENIDHRLVNSPNFTNIIRYYIIDETIHAVFFKLQFNVREVSNYGNVNKEIEELVLTIHEFSKTSV
jgi:hypothetical protein